MKYSFIIFLILSSFSSLGQKNALFEQFDFDSTYKIVGTCSDLNKKQACQKWNFIINNIDKLKIAKQTTIFGDRLEEPVYGDDFEVYIIKDKEIIYTFQVSPEFKYVEYYPKDSTRGFFSFDIASLYRLADIASFSYQHQDLTFKNTEDFNKFLSANKSKTKFLCWEDVSESLSGRFTLTLHTNSKIKEDKDGWNLIEAELNRITPNKDDYLMSFDVTESTGSTFYYQVNTSKSIYDKFNLKGFQKGQWMVNEIEIWTIWLK